MVLTVLEAEKSKIMVLAGSVSGERLLPELQTDTFSLYQRETERRRERQRTPSWGLHPHDLI